MRGFCFYIIISLLGVQFAYSQIKVVAPVKAISQKQVSSFGIGFGLTRSVVFLPQNTQNNNDARGKSIICTYDKGNLARYTFEYNGYKSINFSPTWYNVKAFCLESNVHFLARFKDNDRSLFYPIFGLSFNHFAGYFTGINDYLNLRAIHPVNTTVTKNWLGINAGVGYDYTFKNSAIYFTYKMRVGYAEGNSRYNIQDICITAGYKVLVTGPTLKKLFRGTRSRYVLSKPKKKAK